MRPDIIVRALHLVLSLASTGSLHGTLYSYYRALRGYIFCSNVLSHFPPIFPLLPSSNQYVDRGEENPEEGNQDGNNNMRDLPRDQ